MDKKVLAGWIKCKDTMPEARPELANPDNPKETLPVMVLMTPMSQVKQTAFQEHHMDYRVQGEDGKWRWVNSICEPVLWCNPEIFRLLIRKKKSGKS